MVTTMPERGNAGLPKSLRTVIPYCCALLYSVHHATWDFRCKILMWSREPRMAIGWIPRVEMGLVASSTCMYDHRARNSRTWAAPHRTRTISMLYSLMLREQMQVPALMMPSRTLMWRLLHS